MQEHLHLRSVLANQVFFRREPEAQIIHSLYKCRGARPAGVGEEDLASSREESRHQSSQHRRVTRLVEHVRRENEVESPEGLRLRRAPVEEGGVEVMSGVQTSIVGDEVQSGLVVIRREDPRASCKCHHRREPDAAAEFDGSNAREVFAREAAGEGDRARPELGPVREPLVALEVLLVDEGVGGGGVNDAIGLRADRDGGLGEGGEVPEVRAELIAQRTAAASRAARSSRLWRSASASWAML